MKIATGSTNSYFLSKTGNVYSCGHKYYLGFYSDKDLSKPYKITFPTKYKIIDVVANSGSYHCLALDSNGRAYSWGHNRVGQLGICPKDESMKLYREFDAVNHKDIAPVLLIPKKINYPFPIFKILCGWGHSGFISNGKLFLFGRNMEGQINTPINECKKIEEIIFIKMK